MAKKPSLNLKKIVDEVNKKMNQRKVRVCNFHDHVDDDKTGKKCQVCRGELLKEFRIVSHDNIIGPGHKSHAEVCGYYCSQCGIRYKNLPKWG